MISHQPAYAPRSGRWIRFGALVALIVAVLPGAMRAARRNLAYVQLLHGATLDAAALASGGTRADDFLVLRRSLERSDWITTERMLALHADPDRLAPLIVIDDAERRAKAGNVADARAALSTVSAQRAYDSSLWYRLGEAYEAVQSPREAVQAYERGAAGDPAAPWSEGRYRIAMIYQREERWQPLADLLAPVLGTASDEDLAQPVQRFQPGGAVWQAALLPLGQAYERLGKATEAEATYDRMAGIAAPRRDWTLNRALVYLARARRAGGDFASALEAVRRALDLATEFDPSYRREYELDTAAEADRVIDQARGEGRLESLRSSADDLPRRTPQSPGAWYLRGLTTEASCDIDGARSAYEQTLRLVRPGAGTFLEGRPADPVRRPCPPR